MSTTLAESDTREFAGEQEIIDWQEILDACQVEVDDYDDTAPWENSDGWDHELGDYYEGASGRVWNNGYSRRTERVILTDPEKWGNFEYFRGQGASKQVAAELTARIQHEAREQIADWYNDGWQYFGVRCEMHGCHESCGGIDSEEYAQGEMREEIASQMAYALEEAGYFVTGQPESDGKPYNHLCAHLRWKLAHKGTEGVNAHNWKGDTVRRSKAWRKRWHNPGFVKG